MDDVVRDLRQSLRVLGREKAFSGAVLFTLALCIGANVAIYSVVHTVLLKPLPFPAPDRLVTVFNSYPGAGVPRASNGVVDYFERRENIEAFDEVALYTGSGNTVGEAGSTERVSTLFVTPSFFPLLGVEPLLGRTFTEDEMEVGNHRKVVLTHGYWQEHFGGASDVVGRDLRVDGVPFAVVGVLREDFPTLFGDEIRFVEPLAFSEEARQMDQWHSNSYEMIARLHPGATVEQAVAQNDALNEALTERWTVPNPRQLLEDAGFHTVVVPVMNDLVRDVKPVLLLLWAGVGLVLLIGCVNIANLMLARAHAHVGDVATRIAMGAPRLRVARRALTEALALGLFGGGLGVAIGALGLHLLRSLGAADLPRGAELALDGPVLLFTLLLALGAGALVGAIPVVQIMRGDLSPVFRSGGRTGSAGRRAVLLRNGLVTGQVGLAFVLLIGAGLMLLSFRAALAVDPGFRPDGVLTAYLSLPTSSYEDADSRRAFWDEMLREVRALPGVEAAAAVTQLPFTNSNSSSIVFPEGYVPSPGESLLAPYRTTAAPGYFEALGIELVEGRTFRDSDGPDELPVMVIDDWLARRYWPDRSPLGARMATGVAPGQDSIPEEALSTVIGVVRVVKQHDLTAPASEHVGAYYFTYRQRPPTFVTLTVRSATADASGLTPAIREVLRRLDPEVPLFGIETMQGRIDASLVSRRAPLTLLGVFGADAVFLAAVGIYGSLAYTVAQRTHEIGIRMALGSAPRDVFRAVVGQGLRVTGLGLLLGAGTSLVLTRLIRSLLFDVDPADPRVIMAVALALGLAALAACVVPARRATSIDPVEALTGS